MSNNVDPAAGPVSGANWRAGRGWLWLFLAVLATEVRALVTPGQRDTLSETVWDVLRWSPWRLVLLPLWCWLTYHWLIRREQTLGRWDLIALAIGLAWALLELRYHIGGVAR